jgi:DNA-binding Lrp family transcriptional regulator
METQEKLVRDTVSQWFADSWLLVAENDFSTYNELQEEANALPMTELSDKLREDWETLAEQVTDLVREQISETAGLFIAQILQGWGSYPFDLIARQVKEEK